MNKIFKDSDGNEFEVVERWKQVDWFTIRQIPKPPEKSEMTKWLDEHYPRSDFALALDLNPIPALKEIYYRQDSNREAAMKGALKLLEEVYVHSFNSESYGKIVQVKQLKAFIEGQK